MKHIEVTTLTHKGIKVTYRINYDRGTATLVEYQNQNWKKKEYVFADRGLEYMNGWLDILEAMQVTVKKCKEILEADLAEKTKFRETAIVKAIIDNLPRQ